MGTRSIWLGHRKPTRIEKEWVAQGYDLIQDERIDTLNKMWITTDDDVEQYIGVLQEVLKEQEICIVFGYISVPVLNWLFWHAQVAPFKADSVVYFKSPWYGREYDEHGKVKEVLQEFITVGILY